MTRARRMIERTCQECGVKLQKAEFSPVTPGGEMCGPDGGWEVAIILPGETYYTFCLGYNVKEVCEDIRHSSNEQVRRDSAAPERTT